MSKSKFNTERINKLLFQSQRQDHDMQHHINRIHWLYSDLHDLQEHDDQQINDDQYGEDNFSGRDIPTSNSFLRGQQTERQFHAQQQAKTKFPQITAASIQFSHSQFNISKHDKKSPLKLTSNHSNQPQSIQRIILHHKQQQQVNVDSVIGTQLNSFQKQSTQKQMMMDSSKKRIQGLQEELRKKENEIEILRKMQLHSQKELDRQKMENKRLLEKMEVKDKCYEKMKEELSKAADEGTKTIQLLQNQNRVLKQHLVDIGSRDKYTADTNIQKLRMMDMPNKKSFVMDQQLRKQLSVRTLGQSDMVKQQAKTIQKLKYEKQALQNELDRKISELNDLDDKYARDEQWQGKYDELMGVNKQLQSELSKKEGELKRRQMKQSREGMQKIFQLEKRLKQKQEQLRNCQGKYKQQAMEIVQKNTSLQNAHKTISELRKIKQIQTLKAQQANKQALRAKQELKEVREKLRNMQRNMERNVTDDKVKRKEQDKIEQLKKDVVKLEKEAQQRENIMKEQKKRLDEMNKKSVMARSKITELQSQLNQVRDELSVEKESSKKLTQQVTQFNKRGGDSQGLINKIKILESKLTLQRQQPSKSIIQLTDKLEALEDILRDKEQEVEELKEKLEYALQGAETASTDSDLRVQLEQKQMQLQNYRKQLQLRQKGLHYVNQKLLKAQKQKLQMQAQAKIFQSRFCQTDSQLLMEGDFDSYSGRVTLKRDKIQFLEYKVKMLEERNKILEDKVRDESRKTKTDLKDSSARVEVLVLKNRIKQLTDMLMNKVGNDELSKKIPPESLSPEQTLQFLIETLRRINKSAQMTKLLNRSPQFIQLLRNIDRKKQQPVYTKRLYA